MMFVGMFKRNATLPIDVDLAPLENIIPPSSWSAWLIPALILLALILSLILYLMSRKKPASAPGARTVALQQLQELHTRLLNDPKLSAYQVSVESSGILKNFAEATWKIPVTKRTSEEVLLALKRSRILPPDDQTILEGFLTICDKLKFSGKSGTREQSEKLITQAESLVQKQPPPLTEKEVK